MTAMGYITDHSYVPPQQAALSAPTAPDPLASLLELIKQYAPMILLIVVAVWLLKSSGSSEGSRRTNPKPKTQWGSLPRWKPSLKADERREALLQQIKHEGYKPVLKRLVALANLTGNASATADHQWLQATFGGS
jgi:hypothetical protein